MTRSLFILGTGGHARDVASVAEALDYRPVFVARDPDALEHWQLPHEAVLEADAVHRTNEHFAIGIGKNKTRAAVAERLRRRLHFPTLIHPDTSLGKGSQAVAEGAAGTVVLAGTRITSQVRIGDFAVINLNATLSHDVEISDFVNVSPGANIAGNVRVGVGAWVGVGAAVNQGTDARKLEIGAWTMIGAGAVVIADCEPKSVYVGIPARKIR